MEHMRKIMKMSQKQAQKQFALTQLRKSHIRSDPRQSTIHPADRIVIKNLDSNKVEVYSSESLQKDLLRDVHQVSGDSEALFARYLNQFELEEEQFLQACYQGDLMGVRRVLEGRSKHPVDPRTCTNDEGKNGLHLATISGSYRDAEILQRLKQYGVSLDGKSKHESRTPLMLGCIVGNQGAVRTLLRLGANTAEKDFQGNTALHLACTYQQESIVKMLLSFNANSKALNMRKMRPAQCVPINNDRILELVAQHEAITSGESQQVSERFEEKIKQVAIKQQEEFNFLKLTRLGSGAFGEVFLVRNLSQGREYAMKVLDKASIMRQNILRYALTERQILSTINHPFIVKLHYAFQTADKLCLVMDYCPGGDLSRVIKEKVLEESLLKKYVAQIVLAIEALHQAEIIYRDLKPSNVLLDAEGHACLTDFGLSKEAALAYSFCGSTAYLAPQMVWRRGHTKVIDWYLVGVFIYEALTSRPPFWDSNKEQLMANIKRGQYKKLDATFSPEVKDLIDKLLKSNSSKRLGINGAPEIKAHPWFKELSWEDVAARKLAMPKREEDRGKLIKQQVFGGETLAPQERVNGWDYTLKG